MSGSNLPYHLRVKKDIERRLFTEQLRLISREFDLEEYAYIGMAGPFSEDYRLMNDRFNFKYFFSYEINDRAFKRQEFNMPFTNINYLNKKVSTSIDEYPYIDIGGGEEVEIEKAVLWLDYTDLTQEFLNDFSQAVRELEEGCIIKITLLAHIAQIYTRQDHQTQEQVQEIRTEILKEKLGPNYFYNDLFTSDRMTTQDYPLVLFDLLKRVANKAREGNDEIFVPLTSYIYQDGTVMLTFTGSILNRNYVEDFVNKTKLANWEYSLISNPMPIKIDVPYLSLKEKLHFDACLPSDPGEELQYFKPSELESYKKFYKFYPSYAKIV